MNFARNETPVRDTSLSMSTPSTPSSHSRSSTSPSRFPRSSSTSSPIRTSPGSRKSPSRTSPSRASSTSSSSYPLKKPRTARSWLHLLFINVARFSIIVGFILLGVTLHRVFSSPSSLSLSSPPPTPQQKDSFQPNEFWKSVPSLADLPHEKVQFLTIEITDKLERHLGLRTHFCECDYLSEPWEEISRLEDWIMAEYPSLSTLQIRELFDKAIGRLRTYPHINFVTPSPTGGQAAPSAASFSRPAVNPKTKVYSIKSISDFSIQSITCSLRRFLLAFTIFVFFVLFLFGCVFLFKTYSQSRELSSNLEQTVLRAVLAHLKEQKQRHPSSSSSSSLYIVPIKQVQDQMYHECCHSAEQRAAFPSVWKTVETKVNEDSRVLSLEQTVHGPCWQWISNV